MAYRDLSETHEVTLPDWAPGSTWTLRKHLTDDDETVAARMAFQSKTKIDTQKLRLANRRGEEYEPDFVQEVRANLQLCQLEVMSIAWTGPEFAIPATFKGQRVEDPHAGGVPPVSIHYMNILQTPRQLEDVFSAMKRVWAGRSPEQQEQFRESDSHVADAEAAPEDETAVSVPAGD